MFCKQCGKEITGYKELCDACLKGDIATKGNISVQTEKKQGARPMLWNPSAAVKWSILFSAVFGSFLHMQNWKSLGEQEKARTAMFWFIGALMVFLYTTTIGVAKEVGMASSAPGFSVPLFYLIIWYLFSAKQQIEFVEDYWGDNYERKPWIMSIVKFMFFAFLVSSGIGVIIASL